MAPRERTTKKITVTLPIEDAEAVEHLAYAATRESDHDVLRALLELPVTLHDPLTEADAPELGRILASAADPGALTSDALILACVVHSARRRGWPVLTGSVAALQVLDPNLGIDELP